MTQQTHVRQINNTRTVLPVTLQQNNEAGTATAVDLTGLTVKFLMVDEDGTESVSETTTGVTVVSAAAGTVNYDFSTAGVDETGRYYAYFRVYNGSEFDTFPVESRDLVVCVEGLN